MKWLTAMLLLLGCVASAQPKASLPEKHFEFLEKHCLECHDSLTQEGRVDLEVIPFEITTLKDAETWQKVLNTINAKEMPPEKKPQPSEQEKADFLASLSETLVVARKVLSDSGGVATLRRLNRREYENTIFDLLGIPVDAGVLPSDFTENAFDNTGSSLYISSDQLNNYRKLGLTALQEAFRLAKSDRKFTRGRFDFEAGRNKLVNEQLAVQVAIQDQFRKWTKKVDQVAGLPQHHQIRNEINLGIQGRPKNEFYRRWNLLPGAPPPAEYGFVDAADALHAESQWEWLMPNLLKYISLPHRENGVYLTTFQQAYFHDYFHVHDHLPPAEYRINLRVARVGERELPKYRRELDSIKVAPSKPRRHFVDLNTRDGMTIETFQVHGSIENPNIVSTTLTKRIGEKLHFSIRERGETEGRLAMLNRLSIQETGVPEDPAIWIDYAEYEGPIFSENTTKRLDLLKAWLDLLAQDEQTNTRRVIREFSIAAMRWRSPSDAFVDKLVQFYRENRQAGKDQEQSMAETLSIVLASPGFLYLSEKPSNQRISEIELASRLSYFLNGGPPDALLLEAAAKGQLKDKAHLQSHVARLLRSPNLDRFTVPFLEQWLGLDRLDFFQFNTEKHPDYTLGVKKASRQEIYETFTHWIHQNGSLGHLLSSDTVVINGLLADLYNIPGVVGDQFRPVKVPANSPRGGLLAMAAISAKGSNGEDTSPVERGAWILRKLMNNPPPPAPPNIPQLSRLEGEPLSTKELIALHQEEAQCAQCHRKIDPLGMALENFNAIGKWRGLDDRKGVAEEKRAIDPSGKIYGGAAFQGYYDLRAILRHQYIDDFAHGFAEHLAEYALGRKIGFTDQTFIEEIVSQAKQQNYAIPAFINALVTNDAFRSKR